MTLNDLTKAWPDHAGTHDISDTELARIAFGAANVAEANKIWENEDWWSDKIRDVSEFGRNFAFGGDKPPFSD